KRDWSSDVCSSDLSHSHRASPRIIHHRTRRDGSGCRALDNHPSLKTERRHRPVETIKAERIDLNDTATNRRNTCTAASDSNPLRSLQTAKREDQIGRAHV